MRLGLRIALFTITVTAALAVLALYVPHWTPQAADKLLPDYDIAASCVLSVLTGCAAALGAASRARDKRRIAARVALALLPAAIMYGVLGANATLVLTSEMVSGIGNVRVPVVFFVFDVFRPLIIVTTSRPMFLFSLVPLVSAPVTTPLGTTSPAPVDVPAALAVGFTHAAVRALARCWPTTQVIASAHFANLLFVSAVCIVGCRAARRDKASPEPSARLPAAVERVALRGYRTIALIATVLPQLVSPVLPLAVNAVLSPVVLLLAEVGEIVYALGQVSHTAGAILSQATFLFSAVLLFLALLVVTTRGDEATHARMQVAVEKRRADALAQADREREALMRYIFHEVRVPLNSVVMGMQLLEDDVAGALPADAQETFSQMRAAANAAHAVLSDGLVLASAKDSRQLPSVAKPVHVAHLLQSVVEQNAPLAEGMGVRLEWCVDEWVPGCVLGDPQGLRQVLSNFVTNAIKFCPHDGGGRVLLRAGLGATARKPPAGASLDIAVGATSPAGPAEPVALVLPGSGTRSFKPQDARGAPARSLSVSAPVAAPGKEADGLDSVSVDGSGSGFQGDPAAVAESLTQSADLQRTVSAAGAALPVASAALLTAGSALPAAGAGGSEAAPQPQPELVLSVSDNGCGIPRDELNKLYRAFHQVGAGVDFKGNGTGLGLAIVKHIVERAGGRVGVRSRVGAGSVFFARFALLTPASGDRRGSAASAQTADRHTIMTASDLDGGAVVDVAAAAPGPDDVIAPHHSTVTRLAFLSPLRLSNTQSLGSAGALSPAGGQAGGRQASASFVSSARGRANRISPGPGHGLPRDAQHMPGSSPATSEPSDPHGAVSAGATRTPHAPFGGAAFITASRLSTEGINALGPLSPYSTRTASDSSVPTIADAATLGDPLTARSHGQSSRHVGSNAATTGLVAGDARRHKLPPLPGAPPEAEADAVDSSRSLSPGLHRVDVRPLRGLARVVEADGSGDFIADAGASTGASTATAVATGPLDAAPDAVEPSLPPVHVLAVDDVASNRTMLRRLVLRHWARLGLTAAHGALEFTEAENGRIALDAVASQPLDHFAAVLMDGSMPVMDGYEATRRIRALGYAGTVLAVTANALPGDVQEFLAAGADGVAAKPVDAAHVADVIRNGVRSRAH